MSYFWSVHNGVNTLLVQWYENVDYMQRFVEVLSCRSSALIQDHSPVQQIIVLRFLVDHVYEVTNWLY